ncbi:MAG TPA: cytochrome c biogenesis protein ResB [Planctomycetota bacterium]|nr:cytochrome c biogenesis protein ResB [Planctomycetota bacterium]
MHPCFALFMAFLAVDVVAFLYLPYASQIDADGPWARSGRLGFLGLAVASALAFGLTASVTAERRNRSPWWFVAGHFGPVVAVLCAALDLDRTWGASAAVIAAGFIGVMVAIVACATPLPAPRPIDPLLLGLGRITARAGNIWLGITLMIFLAVATWYGAIVENIYNAKTAHFTVYRTPWFGATWFLGGFSMLAATFRKWPFRLEQAGWLTVHSGLTLAVIGTMMSFFSSVEGELSLREGDARASMSDARRSRLVVTESPRREDGRERPVVLGEVMAEFDRDPRKHGAGQAASVDLGDGSALELTVDAYYPAALPFERWSDDGPTERYAVEVAVDAGGSSDVVTLDEVKRSTRPLDFGAVSFDLHLRRMPEAMYEAMLRKEAPADHGRLVLRDAAGAEIGAVPVPAPPADRPEGRSPAHAVSAAATFGDLKVEITHFGDQLSSQAPLEAPIDASPGVPYLPGVQFRLERAGAAAVRRAWAFENPATETREEIAASAVPVFATYEWKPRVPLYGPLILFAVVDGAFRFVYASPEGETTAGPVVAGEPLPLPFPRLTFTPKRVFRRATSETGFEFVGYKQDAGHEVARVAVSHGGERLGDVWLVRNDDPRRFRVGDRILALSWQAMERPLGFRLKLNDFHRDFYPGSATPRTFESYLELTHPTKFPKPTDVKIDMNHPLRLDGWRLYQARFGPNDAQTFLQVNRDPGLALIYPACSVVLLGLIVVFFLKKSMARRRAVLEKRGASSARHAWEAVAPVVAIGAAPTVYGVVVSSGRLAEGFAAFLVGFTAVVLIPAAVVLLFARFYRATAAPAPIGAPR